MAYTYRIIPCLDVDNGRVVKGTNFVGLSDAGDPVEIAKRYNEEGADELTFLDISASHQGRETTLDMVKEVAKQLFIPLTVGGGIGKIEDIETLLLCGADKISINTAAIFNPDFVKSASEHFGSQCIVVAIDAKKTAENKWEIFTHGGRKPTGINAIEWAKKMADDGAGEILLTSMDRDGTQEGFDIQLIQTVSEAVPIPIIASGGVGNLQHLSDGITLGKAQAVLAASIFHFGKYTIKEAKKYLTSQGVCVRER